MTTLSIVSVKFIFVMLVFFKTIYFDFFKFNDNLFILTHYSLNTHSGKVPPCLTIWGMNGFGIYSNWWLHKKNHKIFIFYPIEII